MVLELPAIRLHLLEDLTAPGQVGFLKLVRHRYKAEYPDGALSPAFLYDQVVRADLDAVVLVPHFEDSNGQRLVYLRSALRPPLLSRFSRELPEPERHVGAGLWELPAGLVEPHENTPEGLRACAERELREEVGFEVPRERFLSLGPSTLPCPGVIAERHYFFDVEVDPHQRLEPALDGSPLEQGGVIAIIPLARCLAMCRSGELDDQKTELGLRRLAEKLQ